MECVFFFHMLIITQAFVINKHSTLCYIVFYHTRGSQHASDKARKSSAMEIRLHVCCHHVVSCSALPRSRFSRRTCRGFEFLVLVEGMRWRALAMLEYIRFSILLPVGWSKPRLSSSIN